MTRLEEIKQRLELFESPIYLPDNYNKGCICGSVMPKCPMCSAIEKQYAKKLERLAVHAAGDLRYMLDMLTH